MSGDQLDLDAIEAQTQHRAQWGDDAHCETMLALVAEVRRLRARFRLCNGCDATLARCNEHIEAGAIKCCPDCRHTPSRDDEVRQLRAQVARSDKWLAAANAVIRERAVDEIAESIE